MRRAGPCCGHLNRIKDVIEWKDEETKVHVRSMSLNLLLSTLGITKIDLLSLDLQGGEIEAVLGLNLDNFDISAIQIECHNCFDDNYGNLKTNDSNILEKRYFFKTYLQSYGYQETLFYGFDIIYTKGEKYHFD